MVVDEDLIPLVVTITTSTVTNLKESLAMEKAKKHTLIPEVRKAWVPKKCLFLINEPLALVARGRKEGGHPYNAANNHSKMVQMVSL